MLRNKRNQNAIGDLSARWNMLLRVGLASLNPCKYLARPCTNLAEAKRGTDFSRDDTCPNHDNVIGVKFYVAAFNV